MILPTKRIPQDRALIAIGAQLLIQLNEPKTVSKLWDEIKLFRSHNVAYAPVTFDWYILSLTFLHSIGAINLHRGKIQKLATK